jgi:hypothetical protein
VEPVSLGGSAEASGRGPALDVHPSCFDCGAPVLGAFCQSCGQRHGPPVQSVRTFFSEAAAELGGLDGRIFRTLRALLLEPGLLTTEYLRGRHTRYVPPLRLYLACSVVYFTLFLASGSTRFFFLWIGSDDPNVDLVTFLRRLPQAMFLLLPAFAAIVALLYRSRARLYAAHLVFALHFHTFAFLVLTVSVAMQPLLIARVASGATGVGGAAAALLAGVAELSVPVYLYLSLRRSYDGSRLGTAARTVVLIVVHMILLGTVSLLTVPPLRDAVWGAVTGGG